MRSDPNAMTEQPQGNDEGRFLDAETQLFLK